MIDKNKDSILQENEIADIGTDISKFNIAGFDGNSVQASIEGLKLLDTNSDGVVTWKEFYDGFIAEDKSEMMSVVYDIMFTPVKGVAMGEAGNSSDFLQLHTPLDAEQLRSLKGWLAKIDLNQDGLIDFEDWGGALGILVQTYLVVFVPYMTRFYFSPNDPKQATRAVPYVEIVNILNTPAFRGDAIRILKLVAPDPITGPNATKTISDVNLLEEQKSFSHNKQTILAFYPVMDTDVNGQITLVEFMVLERL